MGRSGYLNHTYFLSLPDGSTSGTRTFDAGQLVRTPAVLVDFFVLNGHKMYYTVHLPRFTTNCEIL